MIDNSREKEQFQVILQITATGLAELIKRSDNLSQKEAVKRLYASKLYKTLENEETKLWHLSIPALFDLYMEEKETGKITFPEEA
jgi:hypothetical protein